MPVHFLDAGGVLLPVIYIGAFMVVVVLVEALIMTLFKLAPFGQSFLYALLVNVVTLIAGYGLLELADKLEERYRELDSWERVAIFFVVTLLLEGILLGWLVKGVSKSRLWLIVLLMNIVSYGILLFWLR